MADTETVKVIYPEDRKKVELYQLIFHVCITITGQGLNPARGNPIISRFLSTLKDFHYEQEPLKIWPSFVGEFQVQEIDTSKVLCSWQLMLEIADSGPGWADRQNTSVRPLIYKLFENLPIVQEGRYTKKITAEVVNTRFDGELKTGSWPAERF